MTKILAAAALALTFALPTFAEEAPKAPEQKRKIASLVDLESEILTLRQQVENQNLDGAGCAKLFNETYERFWNSTPRDYIGNAAARSDLKKKTPRLIQDSFETRLAIRKRVFDLVAKGQATRDCTNSARNMMRAARYIEDVLGQFALGFPKSDEKTRPTVLKGPAPYLLNNPAYPNFKLQTGDVLVSRGDAFTSAAIARIAEIDAQFSHAAFVYVDEKTGEMSMLEAHIEIGSIVNTMQKYLTDGKTRVVVLRHHDSKLAALAAKRMHDEIVNYKAAHGQNYPYDFKMDETNAKEIFCSELIRRGFELASNGKEILPTLPSRVNPKNPKFIQRLGIIPGETILPGDLELDDHFDLVAEWRDFTRMTDSHMDDTILTTMYDWMDRYGYELHDTGWTVIKKYVAWTLRRWPLFSKLLEEKFPTNMNKNVIGAITTLNAAASILKADLLEQNDKQMAAMGFPLTPREMTEKLDEYRRADLAKWHSPLNVAVLHHIFRPPN